jgi:tight adherence protein B
MTTLLPVVLLLIVAAALLGVFGLWRPLPKVVTKRVNAAADALAARLPQNRRDLQAWRVHIDVFKRLFTMGMKHRWGVAASSLVLVLLGLLSAIGMWAVVGEILKFPVWLTGPAVAIAFWYGPHRLVLTEQERADQAFLDQFPDAIDMIIRMLRAGLPMSVAIRTVARESAVPVSDVFTVVADQLEIGIPFDEALGISSERIGLPDYLFFAAAVALQRTTGGNLTATLEILVDIIRRRRTVRLKAKAATAEERISAYVLAAMPFLVFGALLLVSPDYLRPLFDDRRGTILLVTGIVSLALAFLTMRHMMRKAVQM